MRELLQLLTTTHHCNAPSIQLFTYIRQLENSTIFPAKQIQKPQRELTMIQKELKTFNNNT